MLEVETFIELQYLKYVDVTTGSIEIIDEIFQSWKDPRLAKKTPNLITSSKMNHFIEDEDVRKFSGVD